MKAQCLISLGSNLGDRQGYLSQARAKIAGRYTIGRSSREFNNKAILITDQADFLNQIIEIETNDPAADLLVYLKKAEVEIGRQKRQRYGPREIDIDILTYNDETINLPNLKVPHPGLYDRHYLHQLLTEPPFGQPPFEKHVAAARRAMRQIASVLLTGFFAGISFLPHQLTAQANGIDDANETNNANNAADITNENEKQKLPDAVAVVEDGRFFYKIFEDTTNTTKQQNAKDQNDKAIAAFEADDVALAESYLRQSLQNDDNLPVRLNLIFLYLASSNTRSKDNSNRSVVDQANQLLDDLLSKLSANRRLTVVQSLQNRRFDEPAYLFLTNWLNQNDNTGHLISPPLLQAAKETAALLLATEQDADRNLKRAINIYDQLDIRTGGTDSDVVLALAQIADERQKNPEKSIELYKRLFALNPDAGDTALQHYARLQQDANPAETQKALQKIRNPTLDDIRLQIKTELLLSIDANVDPLINKAAAMIDAKETAKLRYEFFGSEDSKTIASDRRIAKEIY